MIIADWNFNRICNFNCDYCVNDPKDRSAIGPTFDEVKKAVDRLKKEYFWALTGGELLLNPDFIKIAKLLTTNSSIGIFTNLSIPMDNFIKEINPEKVKYIVGSLHIKERDRLKINRNQIIIQYNKLKESGFKNVHIIQICDDYSLSIYEEIYNYYLNEGIQIIPNRLKPSIWHQFKYTQNQENKMKFFHDLCDKNNMFPLEMALYTNKKSQLCIAGHKYILIMANGMVRKCWSSKQHLNFFLYEPFFDENKLSDITTNCIFDICNCYPCNLNFNILG